MATARSDIATGSVVSATDPTTLTMPATWSAGDLALLAVFTNSNTTLTTPSGWTALFTGTLSGASDVTGWLYDRVLQSGDTAPQTDFAAAQDGAWLIAAYSGVDQVTPIEASTSSGNAAGTTHEAGTVATAGPDRMVVTITSSDLPSVQANNWTAFSGYSKWTEFEGSGNENTAVADKLEATAGSYSPDWTSVANDNSLVYTLALKPLTLPPLVMAPPIPT